MRRGSDDAFPGDLPLAANCLIERATIFSAQTPWNRANAQSESYYGNGFCREVPQPTCTVKCENQIGTAMGSRSIHTGSFVTRSM